MRNSLINLSLEQLNKPGQSICTWLNADFAIDFSYKYDSKHIFSNTRYRYKS